MFADWFFCKQKTAYEMRISDWSSDVCSSDLVSDGPNLKQANNKTNTISSSLAEQAIEAWYQANLATLPDPDTIAQSPIGSNDQLGRASGRAGVCQYVEMSVVAVSLKKNKQT